MGAQDVAAVSRFIREAWREAGPGALGWSGATEEDIAEISSEGFLERSAGDPGQDFFIALDGGRVVGMAVGRAGEVDEVELSGIVVIQSLVGRGIGGRLFEKVQGSAEVRGARRIVVKTEESNDRAISFYTRNGFELVGRKTEKVGETNVRLALLSKDLREGRA